MKPIYIRITDNYQDLIYQKKLLKSFAYNVIFIYNHKMNEFEDTVDDLINTENLNSFSVIDQYCEVCSDITPHHVDESHLTDEDKNDDELAQATLVAPISSLECVYCRENEENDLGI